MLGVIIGVYIETLSHVLCACASHDVAAICQLTMVQCLK